MCIRDSLRVQLGDRAGRLVEQGRRHGRPAAQVGDGPELGGRDELRVGRQHGRVRRPVASPRDGLLAGRRLDVRHESPRGVRMAALADDGDRVLDLEGLVRHHVLDRLPGLDGRDGLVLVAQQHVAGTLAERLGRLRRGRRLAVDVVLDKGGHVREPRRRVLAAVGRRRVRGEQIPLSRACLLYTTICL